MTNTGSRKVDLSATLGSIVAASAATFLIVTIQPRDVICATGLNSLEWILTTVGVAAAATLLTAIAVGAFARTYPGMLALVVLIAAVAAAAWAGAVFGAERAGCGAYDDGATLFFVVFVVAVLPGLLGYLIGWFLRISGTPATPRPVPERRPLVEYEDGPEIEAVLDQAATTVRVKKAEGLVLVGASFTDPPASADEEGVRLALAFGKPGIAYEPFWSMDADVTEEVLARLDSAIDGA